MNICFIANFHKTYFFYEISKSLKERYDINTFWIVFNKKNLSFLLKRTDTDKILYLPKKEYLFKTANPIGEFKINELIYGDRLLRYTPDNGEKYLNNIQQPVYKFIKENNIKFVFGEITWAHEVLIFRMSKQCSDLKCKFLNPHTIRIPSNRFAFFEDEFQAKIFEYNKDCLQTNFLKEVFIPQKPDYLALNDQILKKNNSLGGRLKRLKKLLTSENLDENDISLPEKWRLNRFTTPIKNEINKEVYKLIPKVDIASLQNKKFVLITLHKQPEASIDVLGRYVEDQFENIVNIWRQLPHGWWLVVKEHSNAVGDRSYLFYKRLLKYKNIMFIDEKTDSYRLMDICQAVVTVSGTIAYEAALLNKKAIVLADVFFDLSHVKKISGEDYKKYSNFIEILDSIPDSRKDDAALMEFIYNNSFEGIISDPISNPKCIDEENINNIVEAFQKIIYA